MPSPLLAVDAPSLMYRAFFALPDSIKGTDGRPVNALLGVSNLLLLELERHTPRAVILCFGAEAATYRVELLERYHADRPEMPEKLVGQWEDAADYFSAFGWTVASDETLEADDLLGTLAKLEEKAGGEALLYTGDRDMFQCTSGSVKVLYPQAGGRGAEVIGPKEVKRRYGIGPELVTDFIALRGDPSDGIPGAKGVGEKGAAELLREHGSLEGVLENALAITKPKLRANLMEQREELLEFKRIATLQDAPVKRPRDKKTNFKGGAKAARERGMNRLADRLEEMAKNG